MVFLDILVVCEHLSPEVDAESRIDWGCWGFSWGFLFPSLRPWRGRRRIRRLVWRLLGNRYPSNVSPFWGRLRRRWRRGLDGCLDGCLNGCLDWFFGLPLRFGSGAAGAAISAWGSVAFFPLRFGGSTGVSTGSTSAIWYFEIRYENFTTAVGRWQRLLSNGRLAN
jgi:hypothetical protein